ncbi:unnamed protein product, partial [Tetraodon nigroviridis]
GDGDAAPKLHLDLYNFDSPAAEGSRYVLTSPRSLEACARCGVKPVELLPRPLSDFAREAPGRSMRVATGLFEVYEKERHAKLRQCREERERIVREEKRRVLQATANSAPPSGPAQAPASSSSGQDGAAASGPPAKTAAALFAKAPKCGPAKSPQSSKPGSTSTLVSKGAVQGAARPPPQHAKPARPLSSGPPPAARKSPGAKSSNTLPRSAAKAPSFPRANSTLASSASKSGAPPNGVAGAPYSQHNGHLGLKTRGRSHSMESLQRRLDPICSSSSATNTTAGTSSESGASSSYSWDGARDHWNKLSSPRACAMAAFNSLMGRSFSLGDLSHSPQTTQKVERIVREVKRRGLKAVSERDRKIAALMLAKYQEEDLMSQTRYVAHLHWDSERRMEELRREQENREKQRTMMEYQRVWQTQVSLRQQRLSQQEQMSAAARMRQAEENEERWREQAEQQERSRLLRLQQAAREEKHKKVLQEQNLKALEEERAAVLEQERLLLKEKLTMAELKRQEKEHQVQEDRRGLNKAERRRHAALIQEIARREQEEREEARRVAEEKLSRSLGNYEQIRKLEKSEQIFKEKKAVLESARSVARASFHVRDKVREETNVRTFDKMVLEAQLKASLDEK